MDFRTDFWYRILIRSRSGLEDLGIAYALSFNLGDSLFISSNHSSAAQKWQLFPISHSFFLLRNKASGHNRFLPAQDNTSVPIFDDHTNSSTLWTIGAWGDGAFYFGNIASGVIRYLSIDHIDGVRMNPNISRYHGQRAFTFYRVDMINVSLFSEIPEPPPVLIQATPPAESASEPHAASHTSIARSFSISAMPTPHITTLTVPSVIGGCDGRGF